jgi:hypothetical protein
MRIIDKFFSPNQCYIIIKQEKNNNIIQWLINNVTSDKIKVPQ